MCVLPSLGISLWAEGVETLASLALLFSTAKHQEAQESCKRTVVPGVKGGLSAEREEDSQICT